MTVSGAISQRDVWGALSTGYLADGPSLRRQSSESGVEIHKKMKYDVDQYYEAVLGITREAGEVRALDFHTFFPLSKVTAVKCV